MRKEFPLLEKITYLDNAAGTLAPLEVVKAMSTFYLEYPINPHSIDSRLGMHVSNLLIETRKLVASLCDATPEEVIFTSGTTDSLNRTASMLSSFLKPDDVILISPYNHLSNIIPWVELAKRTNSKIVYSTKIIDDINNKVKIIALAQENNTINVELDLNAIYAKAKIFNALVINDAAQAIVHQKVTLKNCDVIVWSGTKLYGPTGVGVLIVKTKLLNKLKPTIFGGGAVADFDGGVWILKENISRFEAGTPNTSGLIGLGMAIKFFNKHKEQGQANVKEVAKYAYDKLSKIEGIKIYSNCGDINILFNIKNYSAQDVVSYLGHKDIILRAGSHCAKMLKNVVEFSSSIRLSIAFYNNNNDIDKTVEAIKSGGDFLDFI